MFDAGDGRKLALERSSNGRCHRVGICARQRGLDANGRIFQFGQVAHGQREIAQQDRLRWSAIRSVVVVGRRMKKRG